MKREALFFALASALVAASIGIALETYVRLVVDDGMQYDLEMWKYARALKQVADPDMGHRHVPNRSARLMGVDVAINAHGLRGTDTGHERTSGVSRVLMLGDSLTFGWGVKFEETTAERIRRLFNEAGRKAEVINAGVGNYNTAMEVGYFFKEGRKYQPDVVVLNYFINDAEPTPRYQGHWLSERSAAWVYLSSRLDVLLRQLSQRRDWADYYRDLYRSDSPGWGAAVDSIRRLAAYCRANDIKLLVVNYPELRIFDPYPFERESRMIAAVAREADVDFLDLYDSVRAVDPAGLWVTPPDPHPNGFANAYFAEAIFARLRRMM